MLKVHIPTPTRVAYGSVPTKTCTSRVTREAGYTYKQRGWEAYTGMYTPPTHPREAYSPVYLLLASLGGVY